MCTRLCAWQARVIGVWQSICRWIIHIVLLVEHFHSSPDCLVFCLIYTFISSHVSSVQVDEFRSFTVAILEFELITDRSRLFLAFDGGKVRVYRNDIKELDE